MKKALSIKQSIELFKRGVDECKATLLAYEDIKNDFDDTTGIKEYSVFSFADVISLLPREIIVDSSRYGLNIWQYKPNCWQASYIQYNGRQIAHQLYITTGRELIDVLYLLLCHVLTNGEKINYHE